MQTNRKITTILIALLSSLWLSGCFSETNTGNCGNGILDEGEECELDNLLGNSCQSLGYYGGTLSCDHSCKFNLYECKQHGYCGDGTLDEVHEECDGSIIGDVTCTSIG